MPPLIPNRSARALAWGVVALAAGPLVFVYGTTLRTGPDAEPGAIVQVIGALVGFVGVALVAICVHRFLSNVDLMAHATVEALHRLASIDARLHAHPVARTAPPSPTPPVEGLYQRDR